MPTFEPIGRIESCFKEKFGIPRQAGLAPEATARLKLPATEEFRQAVRELDTFTHVWIVFVFHGIEGEGFKPLVRPPRLGGKTKVGVLASRSPHRPNPIGISAVKLDRVEITPDGAPVLHLSGIDLLDQTPVLDVKPYLPYCDSIPAASHGWTPLREETPLPVVFAPSCKTHCEQLEAKGYPNLSALLIRLVGLDPRPAFQTGAGSGSYAARISDFDVHWTADESGCTITEVRELGTTAACR